MKQLFCFSFIWASIFFETDLFSYWLPGRKLKIRHSGWLALTKPGDCNIEPLLIKTWTVFSGSAFTGIDLISVKDIE